MFRNPTTDLIVVLVIVLLIFGPKRLPGLGKQLGQGLREFKDSITGEKGSGDEERPEITATSGTPATSDADAVSEPAAAAPAQPTSAPSPAAPPAAPSRAAPERPATPESAEVGSPERRS